MFPDRLHVLDQGLGGITNQFRVGCGFAGTALIKQDNAIELGIEKTPMIVLAAGTRPPMHEQDRNPVRVTALLDMQHMG